MNESHSWLKTSELLLIAACLFFRHCCCDMLWLSFQFLQVVRWLLRCHILLGLRWCFVPLTVLLLSGSVLVACCRAAIPRDLAGHIPTFNRKIPWKIIHEGIHWSDYSLEHPAPSHPSIPKNWPRFFFFFSNFPTIRIPMGFSVKDLQFFGSGRPGQLGGHYAAWSLALLLAYGSAVGSTKVKKWLVSQFHHQQ